MVALAWISLAAMLANGLAKCYCTFREMPRLRLRLRHVRRTAIHELLGYSLWNSLISVMSLARSQGLPVVIGMAVGMRFIGPFSVVVRLPAFAFAIITAATGVFTPLAIRLHANQDHQRRRQLVIEGTRLSFCLALYFVALFVCLGGPLLAIWIRPDFAAYGLILAVIGCGEVLPMSMSIPQGVLQAMAKHQRMASWSMLEAALVLVGSAFLGNYQGLLGVAIALAVAATLFRGLLVMRQICGVVEMRIDHFIKETMLTPLLVAAPAIAVLSLMVYGAEPASWTVLIAYTAVFSLIYVASVALGVIGWNRILEYRGRFVTAT